MIGTKNNGIHTMMFTDASQQGWYQCALENKFGTDEYTVFVIFGKNKIYVNIISFIVLFTTFYYLDP